MEREFSAGGLCVRQIDGRDYVAAIRVKGRKVLALPKGNIDPGEKAPETVSGDVEDHDHEVDSAEWVPLEEAERQLEYKGEKQMAAAALTAWAEAR